MFRLLPLLDIGSRRNAPLWLVRWVNFFICKGFQKKSETWGDIPCSGISTCGSGFGTIVFAPVVTALLQVSNWQWTNRIIAGFCLLVISSAKYVNISAFPLICILCSVHPAWSDHETCAKAKVWQHRQHHRNEKEKRADYQGRLEGMIMYFMTLSR